MVQQLMQYFLSDAVQSNLSFFGASPMPPQYVSAPFPNLLPAGRPADSVQHMRRTCLTTPSVRPRALTCHGFGA